MILFETTASALELLWDIAIALLIIRLALLYFALTFLTGCILGYIRVQGLIPTYHLSQRTAELLEMPVMLLAVFMWARFIIARYSLPEIAGLRLVIGFLALGFMLLAELGGRVVLYEQGFRGRFWDVDEVAGGAFAVSLALFGLMPWLLMVGRPEDGSARKVELQENVSLTPTAQNLASN